MPKPIVFIAALLLALPAFAQTRMPARQVEADTNMVNIAISLPFTVQAALDWIDANWPALSSESWSNLDPAEDTVQSVFDWVDDNWQAELDDSGWLFLDPESPTTQSVFDWIDANWGMDASGWDFLDPERYSYTETDGEEVTVHSFSNQATAQATFDWLDGHLGAAASDFNSYTSRFSSISNDFRVLEAYMLGGCVSNGFTNVCWSADGSATNAALVRALQYNQDKYLVEYSNRFALSLDHAAYAFSDNDFVLRSAVEGAHVTITDYEHGYASDLVYTGAFDHAS
ncbi:MAG TPA: hypothetical protein PKN69_05530, partial [Candidatus Latescibacteria bacterium]|nr:hypothetical protein [Candidatus Latescibacterota bacterium]